ncbi:calcium-translocating P-type ATPase, PMCA-type [Carnobacterium maltaromaticum]|uniref:calcium-translocating P-type ATPase, PMCA-type n=1 Tax=Carnobacterium maltaromaticum TaxID=2751 RepID=UPI00295F4A1E|nr:calcium-translocating P-type ATPase, PMCA-type [Carnobacterium maltaromaticum]MDW5525096.1 calcium-translocating P-type ATPase, PMCA-type [Carnobacterium maltaromaticum]
MNKTFVGLTKEEVEESRQKHGSNALTEKESETFFDKLKGNFDDPIIKILLVALVLNLIFAFLGYAEWFEAFGIAIAVLLATLIGTWSEFSNETAFQKLQEDASKITVKVFRDGHVTEISIDDIVQGDEIILQTGDKIPADGILIDGSLRVDQASLNGESDEAKKETLPEGATYEDGDTFNKHALFRGAVITSGEAVMKVTKVGDASFFGQMAAELTVEERESPLKLKLADLANKISKAGYTAGVLIFIAFMINKIFVENNFNGAKISEYFSQLGPVGNDIVEAFILAVIVIVVAVPEGLPMMIAMVLSQNMKKMLRDNILVRKLEGIETSGSLNMLFSDKTGTITKGQLDVVSYINGANTSFDKLGAIPEELKKIVSTTILNNTNAVISEDDQGAVVIIGGNPTEKAVLAFVEKDEKSFGTLEHVSAIPFSSARKFSATQVAGEWNTTLIKGAPEKILPNCSTYYDEQGQKQPFTKLAELDNEINELAKKSIRVLILATTDEIVTEESLPSDYTLVGILAIRDDVRPEAVEAIHDVQQAGVQVVMITGDRKETAIAIAKDAKILQSPDDIVLTSQELNDMPDEEVKSLLPNMRVIARALPTDKSRLVRLSQEIGLVVGMTGDGVNDSPALKRADVGFAMGSGTEVAKEAGDIVILDDNFKSIAQSILFGRTIYRSIQKFIVFQLTLNVGALLISFIAPFIGIDHPLTITQMLWVNLVMDTLAALAFGAEPTLKRYMKEKPKRRDENIVTRSMFSAFAFQGVVITIMGLWMLKGGFLVQFFDRGTPELTNLALTTGFFSFFILYAVFNGFNVRTEKLNIFDNLNRNKMFMRIMLLIIVVQIIMTFVGGPILRTTALSVSEWAIVLGLSVLAIPIDMARKLVVKAMGK